MKKSTAIKLLGGSRTAAAEAIGISYQAVTQWPEDLPQRIEDRVYAAFARLRWPGLRVDENWVPACFESQEQIESWRKSNVPTKSAAVICEDCTPEYRDKMLKAGRCHEETWQSIKFGPGMFVWVEEEKENKE